MEILNIAKEQLNLVDQRQTLEKYHDFFEEIREFGPKDQNYLQAVRKRVRQLDDNMAKRGRGLIGKIVKEKVNLIQRELDTEEEPGLIIFIGNGIPDGHAILLDGNPYAVIDLKTFVDRLDAYDQAVYLTHEVTHAFHYKKTPSFYFGNKQKILKPPIFKMMIAEGVATYCSFLFTPAPIHDAYWFGQYTEKQVKSWVNICEREKGKIGEEIDTGENKVSPDIMEKLFDTPVRDLGESRLGYCYGTKIVRKVIEEKGLDAALKMELYDYRNHVYRYFDL